MLAEAIKNISSKYLEEKNKAFANNELASYRVIKDSNFRKRVTE